MTTKKISFKYSEFTVDSLRLIIEGNTINQELIFKLYPIRNYFYIDIYDNDDEPLLQGFKVNKHVDLLKILRGRIESIPDCQISASIVNTNGIGKDFNLDNAGKYHEIIIFNDIEVENE